MEVRVMQVEEVIIEGVNLIEKIKKSEAKDNKVVKVVEEMKQAEVKVLRDEEWQEEDGVILRDKKVYVPKDKKLRAKVIWLHHDILVGEHGGQQKTTELVTRNFQWPRVTKEVKKYVEGCDACQRNKNQTEAPARKLIPNSTLEKPWAHISMDFITKLLLAQGYDLILVVCNHMTKIAHFVPTIEKTLAEGLARLFRDHIWKLL